LQSIMLYLVELELDEIKLKTMGKARFF